MNVPRLAPVQCEAVRRAFPETADDWIDAYPDLVSRCVKRWGLTLTGNASGGLPINVIHFAVDQRGRELVLKLGHSHPEQVTEMIALDAYGGRLAPALIDCNRELGATLMERILPGTTFRASAADRSRSEARLEIFSQLGRPSGPIDGLPTYADWLRRAFAEFHDTFVSDHPLTSHIDRAARAFESLGGEPWLLHGDLHHENLLLGPDGGWIAIDPKGVLGPRALECGRFVHNFLEDEMTPAERSGDVERAMGDIVQTRAFALAEVMGCPPDEILLAGYIDAVLGTCWTINDGGAHPAREVRALAQLVG